MYTIRVLINVQCANGSDYQITTNVSLETCRTLLQVKTHCLALGRLNADSATTFIVNDAEELDEGYILEPTDSVEIKVIEDAVSSSSASTSAVAPSSTAASTSAVAPSSTAASTSAVAPSLTAASTSAVAPSSTAASTSALAPSPTAASASSVTPLPSIGDFHFTAADNYHDWENINAFAILDCWAACIPNKNIKFGSTDLYSYFCNNNQKTAVVLYGHLLEEGLHGRMHQILMNQTVSQLLKISADLIQIVHPRYDIYTSGINVFLTAMHRWLNFPIFLEWSKLSSKSRLHSMIKKRRNYYVAGRNRNPIPTFTAAHEFTLDQHAAALREHTSTAETENELKRNQRLRKSWIRKLVTDPSLERGVATVFFQKFPIYSSKLELLRIDYEFTMNLLLDFVPNLAATLRKYAPTVINVATLHSLEILGDEQDQCLKALTVLPDLIKSFYPRSRQGTISYLLNVTHNLNINAALAIRKTFTTSPSLIATKWSGRMTYYVAVDDYALHTSSTDIAEALQRLFEVYYVLDLAYDVHMKDFFQLLENLMGMKTVPAVPVQSLVASIQYYHDNPHTNIPHLLDASSGETSTAFNDTDPLDGIDLITGLRTLTTPSISAPFITTVPTVESTTEVIVPPIDTVATSSTQASATVETVVSTTAVNGVPNDTAATSSAEESATVQTVESTTEDRGVVAQLQSGSTLVDSSDFIISHSWSQPTEDNATSSLHFTPSISPCRGRQQTTCSNRQSSFATSTPTTSQQISATSSQTPTTRFLPRSNSSTNAFPGPPPKRGRGRPRKYPPPIDL